MTTIKIETATSCARMDHSPPWESPHAPFYRETWFWEQVAYVLVCLVPATIASNMLLMAKGPISSRDMVLLAGMVLSQFIAQKARSVASRQAALLKRRGMYIPEVRCAPKMKRWIQAGQVLSAFLAMATAPTWWHVPSILWAVFGYDIWRSYREERKQPFVVGGF